MFNENYYTPNAYEDNGRFQIHPLSSAGLEAYLSKDSYNYHFLKSKYDPELLRQIQEEANSNQKENHNKIQTEPEKKENKEKIEEIKEKTNSAVENKLNEKNKKIQNKKINNKTSTQGNKQIKQKGNNLSFNNKIKNNNPKTSITQKINNIGKSVNPVICNVNNGRGKLADFQQPFHA